MSLSHIPTVASVINRLQRGDFDPHAGFDEVISELQEISNSWRTTALAVGGKPERAPEYIIARNAIVLVAQLREMSHSKYQPTMPGEAAPHAPA